VFIVQVLFALALGPIMSDLSASARISKGQGYLKASQGKGQGAVLAKKGQFASYKEKLEKWIEFHSFLGQ
jgi:hypothetical protein